MISPTREQVMTEAQELMAYLPTLVERYHDDAEFWPAFASAADPIMELAAQVDSDTHEDVFLVIESMLFNAGKFDADHVLQT